MEIKSWGWGEAHSQRAKEENKSEAGTPIRTNTKLTPGYDIIRNTKPHLVHFLRH